MFFNEAASSIKKRFSSILGCLVLQRLCFNVLHIIFITMVCSTLDTTLRLVLLYFDSYALTAKMVVIVRSLYTWCIFVLQR